MANNPTVLNDHLHQQQTVTGKMQQNTECYGKKKSVNDDTTDTESCGTSVTEETVDTRSTNDTGPETSVTPISSSSSIDICMVVFQNFERPSQEFLESRQSPLDDDDHYGCGAVVNYYSRPAEYVSGWIPSYLSNSDKPRGVSLRSSWIATKDKDNNAKNNKPAHDSNRQMKEEGQGTTTPSVIGETQKVGKKETNSNRLSKGTPNTCRVLHDKKQGKSNPTYYEKVKEQRQGTTISSVVVGTPKVAKKKTNSSSPSQGIADTSKVSYTENKSKSHTEEEMKKADPSIYKGIPNTKVEAKRAAYAATKNCATISSSTTKGKAFQKNNSYPMTNNSRGTECREKKEALRIRGEGGSLGRPKIQRALTASCYTFTDRPSLERDIEQPKAKRASTMGCGSLRNRATTITTTRKNKIASSDQLICNRYLKTIGKSGHKSLGNSYLKTTGNNNSKNRDFRPSYDRSSYSFGDSKMRSSWRGDATTCINNNRRTKSDSDAILWSNRESYTNGIDFRPTSIDRCHSSRTMKLKSSWLTED